MKRDDNSDRCDDGRAGEHSAGALTIVTAGHAAAGVRQAEVRVLTRRGAVRRAAAKTLTVICRKRFLETLAATCNVALSARTAGCSPNGARQLRERDAEFSTLWDKALRRGKERLREDLLAHALGHRPSGNNPADVDFDAPRPEPFDPNMAIKVLTFLDGSAGAGAQRRAAAPTQGQVDAALLARLDALVKRGRG